MITNDLRDDEDINRVMKKFYCDFNRILRNFHFTDVKVKLFLFRQYCLQFYGCDLWVRLELSKRNYKFFAIAYHKAIKKILNLSSHESNHYACQEGRLHLFHHFINKLRIMSAYRLLLKPCIFFRKLSFFMLTSSVFLNGVVSMARQEYDIHDLLDNDSEAVLARIVFKQNHERQMRQAFDLEVV